MNTILQYHIHALVLTSTHTHTSVTFLKLKKYIVTYNIIFTCKRNCVMIWVVFCSYLFSRVPVYIDITYFNCEYYLPCPHPSGFWFCLFYFMCLQSTQFLVSFKMPTSAFSTCPTHLILRDLIRPMICSSFMSGRNSWFVLLSQWSFMFLSPKMFLRTLRYHTPNVFCSAFLNVQFSHTLWF